MRAVRCTTYGTPEALTLEELPDPAAGTGEVVVDVSVAAVNFPDVLFVANRYQISVPPPFTPGSEFAGTIAAVGAGVVDRRVGERVRGTALTGAFAEKIVVPATAVQPVPPGLDLAVAVASGVTFS